MPETADWAAAPQTGVQVTPVTTLAPSGTVQDSASLVIGVAGTFVVIVGLDVVLQVGVGNQEARGVVTCQLQDSVSGLTILSVSVSPEAPWAAARPPFGSLRSQDAANLTVIAQAAAGLGQSLIQLQLYYYQQAV